MTCNFIRKIHNNIVYLVFRLVVLICKNSSTLNIIVFASINDTDKFQSFSPIKQLLHDNCIQTRNVFGKIDSFKNPSLVPETTKNGMPMPF